MAEFTFTVDPGESVNPSEFVSGGQFPKLFRTIFRRLLPPWLTREEGELVLYSLGVLKDAFAERTRLGLLSHFPQYAPPDALPYHGRDRLIVRGRGESNADYAARLIPFLEHHRTRGNPFVLLRMLYDYVNAPVRIRTVDRNGNWFTLERDGSTFEYSLDAQNWQWDELPEAQWSRFWVIIYPDNGDPWELTAGTWNSAHTAQHNDHGLGVTIAPDEVAAIRNIIRTWQPDGTRCEWIIIATDDASFDPASPEPDGLWGKWGKPSGSDIVPSRLATAEYICGIEGGIRP